MSNYLSNIWDSRNYGLKLAQIKTDPEIAKTLTKQGIKRFVFFLAWTYYSCTKFQIPVALNCDMKIFFLIVDIVDVNCYFLFHFFLQP